MSIAWSKSALHARCRVCRRKGNAEQMLLCDLCDRGHHMYCLKPALKVKSQISILKKVNKKIMPVTFGSIYAHTCLMWEIFM